jgi:mannose-6-phosphate isomerase-like protein (cupin superfamily)
MLSQGRQRERRMTATLVIPLPLLPGTQGARRQFCQALQGSRRHGYAAGLSPQMRIAGQVDLARTEQWVAPSRCQQTKGDGAMKTQTEPTIFQPTADQPAYWVVDHRMTVLIPGEQTHNAYSVLEAFIVPGGGTPLHIHHREDELFYVLEGDVTLFAGEQTTRARAGACVHVPAGSVHNFRNEGDGPARLLITYTPAGFENYFSKAGTPTTHGDQTAPPVTQEALERLQAYAAQFSLEIIAPERA